MTLENKQHITAIHTLAGVGHLAGKNLLTLQARKQRALLLICVMKSQGFDTEHENYGPNSGHLKCKSIKSGLRLLS
ncbi:MAG: hypothetical protein Ct9H300mP4_12100 [Gammaproteobacteria bacterium]|nr:MAG: hypothetical protein Ct9H300mP4_12100 [Gammaproteobacteria bacterium]